MQGLLPASLAKCAMEWHEFFRDAAGERLLDLLQAAPAMLAATPAAEETVHEFLVAQAEAASVISDKLVVRTARARRGKKRANKENEK